MTPEEKARRDIDRQLDQCGWLVQDRSEMHISAGPGVAVREFPMITGEADYLLYAGGKAIGVVANQPMHLAGLPHQVDILQRLHAAEALADALQHQALPAHGVLALAMAGAARDVPRMRG